MQNISLFQAISNTTKGLLSIVDDVAASATAMSKTLRLNSEEALADTLEKSEMSKEKMKTIKEKQALFDELRELLY